MLQFRLKRVIIRSDAETQRVSIVCPDGAQYVIQFTTDDDDDDADDADDDHFHEFEAYLLCGMQCTTQTSEMKNVLF